MSFKVRFCAGLLASLILSALQPVFSQAANEEFGKNRIQYKNFNWRFYNTDNFDIYYYDGGDWLARISAEYLEEEFNKVTDMLGYAPYFKTKIFIYNSIADLHQSNVGMQENKFTEGGQTEFVKTHVEVAYPGSAIEFKDDLIFRISKMLIYDMMYGGSLTDMFQNSYLLNLPEWFMDGAALYLAKGWDVALDDYMRDLMQEKKVKNLNKFTGDEAKMVGQSIWNFIAEKYGKSNISNILNLTRIIRNEERSISNTLGISFRNFMFEWQSYYAAMGAKIAGSYQSPSKENFILNRNRKDLIYPDLALSPDGSYLAYVEVNSGKYTVKVVRLNKNNRGKNVLSGGYKLIEQEFNEYQPTLAWQDQSILGIVGPLYGRTQLWLFNMANNQRIKKDIGKLNNVRSFDLDRGGSLAVLSADVDGKNDLFLISLRRNSIKRITNDIFDEKHPRFIPNTSSIIFSSNRTTDSLNVSDRNNINDLKSSYNLFTYSIDTTRNVLGRLTNTLNDNIKPIPANETDIYYLSDQKGIFNLYRYNLSSRIYNQVSNYALSLKDFDMNAEKSQLTFISIDKENEQIYMVNDFNFDNNIFTAQTTRQEVSNAKLAAQRILQRRALAAKDSVEKAVQTPAAPPKEKSELEKAIETSDDLINTDNYAFEPSIAQEAKPRESFLEAFRKSTDETRITGPHDYETRFSANNVVTTFVFDPIIGFGIQLKAQLTDLLENHKFYGGITATTDFTSGKLFAEYQYLKSRLDYKARFDRNIIQMSNQVASQKYILNKLKVTASLPFTVSSRISVSPFVANTSYYDLGSGILSSPTDHADMVYYGGVEANYVFDNTIATNLNSYEGLRAKLSFTHYEGLEDKSKSFSNVHLDIRNYQKIYRELVFATRFYYGRFFGPNKQTYLLGGMDNWILSKTVSREGERDPLQTQEYVDNSNILFLEYVTNLRGFSYNTFNGANAMLFNAELRLPLLRVLYKGPIASNFFRNLQFIGFYDIGSAWTGNSPFATENSINTETITSGPFEVRLKNFRNPWLSSYGLGVRTVVLGYYAKFDFAYPIEDYVVQKPRFHVTLGYDF